MLDLCRKYFATYYDVCFREFGDRFKSWTTLNEVNVYAMLAMILEWHCFKGVLLPL